jgi:hypothetical protein
MQWYAATAFALVVFGCAGSSDDNSASAAANAAGVGKRCSVAGDCALDLMCKTDFAGERGVCTRACDTDAECPASSVCVTGIRDYNSQPLPGFCMQACTVIADCASLGSVCDEKGGGLRLCF